MIELSDVTSIVPSDVAMAMWIAKGAVAGFCMKSQVSAGTTMKPPPIPRKPAR